MGLFDRFLDAVRLNDDYDEDDDDFFDEDDDFDDVEEKPKRKLFGGKSKSTIDDDFDDEPEPMPAAKSAKTAASANRYASAQPAQRTAAKPAQSQKVTPMRRNNKVATLSSGGMEVCVIKPSKVEDYREIAETLLSGCTVVLNLEGIDVELAQRIIDFSSGSCYAIGGGLQKVSSYIFILTPSSVEISGDIQDLLNGAMPTMRTSF